jgi:hypothetical protein
MRRRNGCDRLAGEGRVDDVPGQGTKEQTYNGGSSKTDNLLVYEYLKEKVRTAA